MEEKKGLQVAYYYEQGRAEEAINQAKQYKELSDKRSEIIFEQDKQICHLNEVIKECLGTCQKRTVYEICLAIHIGRYAATFLTGRYLNKA